MTGYTIDTNRNANLAEYIVICDLMEKGWESWVAVNRDSKDDLVTEITNRGKVGVQVKVLGGPKRNRVKKEENRSNQRVTVGGKIRNNSKVDSDLLAVVDLRIKKPFYYWRENYEKIPSKSFSIDKWPPDIIPTIEIKRNIDY
jgi:hypothetical protein